MTEKARKRVVWLYDGDHLNHPFIRQAAESLVDVGYSVTILDRAITSGRTRYRHIALGQLVPHLNGVRLKKAERQEREQTHWPRSRVTVPDRLLVKALSAAKIIVPVQWRSRLNTSSFLSRILLHTIARRPAIIIATSPTVAAMGWLASEVLRSRFVYYPFELYGEQHVQVPRLWRRVELQILRRGVHALITQNEERARIYVQERGARVEPSIVHNYKRRQRVVRVGKLRTLLGLPDDVRIVLYEGSLSPGRWLEKLVESAPHLPDDTRLVFMGKKFSWWMQNVEPLLIAPEMARKILIVPEVSHSELLNYVADAEVGIIIYDDQVRNNYYCAPGKLSDYVLAGVPVVAPNFPTIAPIISHYAIGATFTSPEPVEIARAIIRVLSVPREAWQTALQRAQEDLVWETQAPGFLTAVGGE